MTLRTRACRVGTLPTYGAPGREGVGGQSNGVVGFGTYQYGEPFEPGGKNSFGKLSQTPQISDNVTKIQGAHTLKAGVYWDFSRNYQTGGNLGSGAAGAANFDIWGSSTSTRSQPVPRCTRTTCHA